jgi:predicted DNA-binding protein
MPEKMDKARKLVSAWAITANRLRQLSETTGKTQVELLHEAIQLLADKQRVQERAIHVS